MAHVDPDDLSPAARRRSKVRDSILEAAENAFAKDGEAGLSIRQLAETIDYSPAAIYKYFNSKEELMDELKEAFFARLLEALDELERDGDGQDAYMRHLRKGLMTYMCVALEKPHHYAAAFAGLGGEAQKVPIKGDGSKKTQAFLQLHDLVAEGVELGVFRADLSVSHAAKSVWASCHGLVLLMSHIPAFGTTFITTPDSSTRESLMAEHVDFILRGLSR